MKYFFTYIILIIALSVRGQYYGVYQNEKDSLVNVIITNNYIKVTYQFDFECEFIGPHTLLEEKYSIKEDSIFLFENMNEPIFVILSDEKIQSISDNIPRINNKSLFYCRRRVNKDNTKTIYMGEGFENGRKNGNWIYFLDKDAVIVRYNKGVKIKSDTITLKSFFGN